MKAFEVLSNWLRDDETCHRANIVQSLALFDKAAIPVIPYSECATCIGMLYKLTEDAKYKGILERLSQYPDDLIKHNVKSDLEEVSLRH